MLRAAGKTLSVLLITLLGITVLSFGLSYLSPSDPAEILLTENGIAPSQELLQKTREELGLNSPVYIQYWSWLTDLLQGDMGSSIKSNRPVGLELMKSLPNTLMLAVSSMLATIAVSVPLGVVCAKYQGSWFDRTIQLANYIFISLPVFFISLILMYVLALKLNLLPVISSGSGKGIIMPALALSLNLIAVYVRQIRAIVLREMQHDYVLGLYARGVPGHTVFFVHIVRNTLTPIVTLTGISLGTLLGGTIIVESIFNWPGVGKLAVEAIQYRDYPVIQGYVVWMAFIYFLINALIELIYLFLNPKLRKV
ncbi:ABC transporter permease [Paenibacillus sp. YN15]|uniref:ABC transporter permease n=1 Tax=Paenibacillus sp. YN15 TaxID=1742774 RepID=UPI001C65F744|nr:ABC transporter permease [Paenibacillus sp. YN15]